MRDMLEPIFGETGAIAAQFVITLVVVLALVAVVYWLVRRYAGVRLGSIARGRVPRLAIVDAMAIDRRRRLVLVRRDNAEHLILIGGPSDLLVEGPIRRVSARHRAELLAMAKAGTHPGEAGGADAAELEQPEIAVPEPEPQAPVEEPPEPAPVQIRPAAPIQEAPRPAPPPPARNPVRRAIPVAPPAEPAAEPVAEAPPPQAEVGQPEPRGTMTAIAAAANDHPAEAASAKFADIVHPTAIQPIERPDNGAAEPEPHRIAEANQAVQPDAGDAAAPIEGAAEGTEEANPDTDTAAKVSDLEREMAKLLGEIGTRNAT